MLWEGLRPDCLSSSKLSLNLFPSGPPPIILSADFEGLGLRVLGEDLEESLEIWRRISRFGGDFGGFGGGFEGDFGRFFSKENDIF